MSIILLKGQSIALTNKEGHLLTQVAIGLGWDAKNKRGYFGFGKAEQDVDLDISCIFFDEAHEPIDAVWFRALKSQDGSVHHTGDNRTGLGSGHDEEIIIDLTQVPQQVRSLLFMVTSFSGQRFSQVKNLFCNLKDTQTEQNVVRFDLTSDQDEHTGQIMVNIYRDQDEWKIEAIGKSGFARTFHELMPAAVQYLSK